MPAGAVFNQAFASAAPVQGPLHRLDPRARLAGAVVLCVLVAICQDMAAALAGLVLGLLWLALALPGSQAPLRPSLQQMARRLLVVNIFVVLLWCTTPWATPGAPLATLGPVTLTREGVRLALLVTLKANALACIFMALLATLDIPALAQSLRFFRCPDKMVLLLLMALRNIHVLGDEWQRLRAAARLRGFAPRCSLHTYKTLASLLGLLLLRSLDRATRVREAMLLRGFQGHFPAVAQRPLRMADAAFMLAVLVQGGILCWLEFGRML